MTETIQILVLLLAVIAAVAVVAGAAEDSAGHSPGAHRRRAGAVPGPADGRARAGVRAAAGAAADHLLVGGGDELARVPLQSAPDLAAGRRLRRCSRPSPSPRATHWLLGLAWPVGFVLGAIVSPPDAVAPLSIARRMQLPRRILVILEGEGLANDATALILYRFAVAAVSVGRIFVRPMPPASFAAIVAGEILWGIGVGWLMLRLRRWVRDPRIEIMLSVLTPFLAYWPPEHLGGSGVLATVTAGLYISWNGLRLISAATRLQGIFFWDFLIYLIEGMVFLITGLQARTLIAGIGSYSTVRARHLRRGRQRRGDRQPASSGCIPRPICRAGSFPPIAAQGSVAALAMAVRAGLHRSSRHRLAGGGAGDPVHDRERRSRFPTATSSCFSPSPSSW